MFLELNQRVIVKRTSQIMKYGQDVIIQKRTDHYLLEIIEDINKYIDCHNPVVCV